MVGGVMGLGLFAGLMFGSGHPGGGMALAVAGAVGVWLLYANRIHRDEG